VLLVRRA
jgi:hypothetical protein